MTEYTEIRSTAPMSFVMSAPDHEDVVIKGANDQMAKDGAGHTIVPVAMYEAWLASHEGLDMIANGALTRIDPEKPADPAAEHQVLAHEPDAMKSAEPEPERTPEPEHPTEG